jgi:hypothetical protein
MEETKPHPQNWPINILREHIQYAVDLEFWTIPFYMCAMYSIVDRTAEAFQLLQSIVNQEMLHLQSIANISNAFGVSPIFDKPVYSGRNIPHLDFKLDKPDPRPLYEPYSAEIGALDIERLNAMCLIEYPDYLSSNEPDMNPNISNYSNIGEFYLALQYGASQRTDQLRGGIRQVDLFSNFYRNLPSLTITDSGELGFYQVYLLMNLITDQGEGISKDNEKLKPAFQNTANDREQELSHYMKFTSLKAEGKLPEIYPVKEVSTYTTEDIELQHILHTHFKDLRLQLEAFFKGDNPQDFYRIMFSVGAAIQNCWKHGVVPKI